jgi:hypothetical protein
MWRARAFSSFAKKDGRKKKGGRYNSAKKRYEIRPGHKISAVRKERLQMDRALPYSLHNIP